jgi:hypothetical protein
MYAFMAIVAHYVNKDGQLGLLCFDSYHFQIVIQDSLQKNFSLIFGSCLVSILAKTWLTLFGKL